MLLSLVLHDQESCPSSPRAGEEIAEILLPLQNQLRLLTGTLEGAVPKHLWGLLGALGAYRGWLEAAVEGAGALRCLDEEEEKTPRRRRRVASDCWFQVPG
ncbi:hypothetical protein AV530_019281 [Patagioenas fasciata monilis]|uniref:Uncharacterized protein n=1 Tax=Patagioenas fasciata monilis TaxID=372326 RepID=A0A1V4JDA7_PATFA|nr:hypothetical protein AV530_019281 [Patagioenas fasciata monilis]